MTTIASTKHPVGASNTRTLRFYFTDEEPESRERKTRSHNLAVVQPQISTWFLDS